MLDSTHATVGSISTPRSLRLTRGTQTCLFRTLICLWYVLLASGFEVASAAPPAGTLITNQITSTFLDATLGSHSSSSNVVQLAVAQKAGFTLVGDLTKTSAPGSAANFPHTLTNIGNGSDSFTLLASVLPGAFAFASLQIFIDANADGVPDNNVPITSSGPLAAGAVFHFVVVASVPSTAAAGSSDSLRVDATSALDPTRTTTGASPPVAPLTDLVNVVAAPVLTLSKSVASSTAQPGDTLIYQLNLRNSGGSAAQIGASVSIDGTTSSPVLVRDALPPNTTLAVSIPIVAGVIVLYHRVGDPDSTYVSMPPADLGTVDAVAWAIATVPVGANFSLSFSVRIHSNAAFNGSGSVVNTGQGFYSNGVTPVPTQIVSNDAQVTLTPSPAALRNYTGADYSTIAAYARLGSTLFLRADAASCNSSAATVEKRTVVITGPNGEHETLTATETGPNTGVFTIPAIPTSHAAVVPNDGIIEAQAGDVISVSIQGCGASIVTQITLVDPFGTVFDSSNNQPISGAAVTLVIGNGAGGCTQTPAVVHSIVNGVIQPAPSTVTTGATGTYLFELTDPGNYCLVVKPPAGYTGPSIVPVSRLPAGRTIVATGPTSGGSYSGNFLVGPTTGPVRVDIPLDTSINTTLFLEKIASRTLVELADFVDYTVRIKNTGTARVGAPGITIVDQLPSGFTYVPGSVRINGNTSAGPLGGRGPRLTFNSGGLDIGAVTLLTYRVFVGPGAMQGDAINRVQANVGAVLSNLASAKVSVQGGVFDNRGFIVGKIFLDCNRNRVQDEGELGVPGVRVYLEDGTSAISDHEGKYNFYGVRPRTHVLKVDTTTLPAGWEFIDLSNRHAGDAGSAFVDLKNGELAKTNFAEGSCNTRVMDEVQARRLRPESPLNETERALAQRIEADPAAHSLGDVRAQPAAGVVGSQVLPVPSFTPLLAASATPFSLGTPNTALGNSGWSSATESTSSTRVGAAPALATRMPLEKLLPSLDQAFGFVDLHDGDTLPIAQTDVRLKGQSGTEFNLSVNGVNVAQNRVGKKSVMADKQIQAWEYIGVALKPGHNELVAHELDSFGIERASAHISLIAPDFLANVQIVTPSSGLADGHTTARIIVKLVDAANVPVTTRTAITLESSMGHWMVEDLDRSEPGIQTFIEGGHAEFLLEAPDTAGEAVLQVSSGSVKTEAKLDFLPNLRPMIAAGLIEGVLNLRRLDPQALVPTRSQDSFEQELRQLSVSANDGKTEAAARTALFLKGKVRGNYLLTLAYDSDKDTRERLFRDIQPDEFYPVYGDSAVRNYDAQSTSKLYVRLENGKSWLLYGDFVSQMPSEARKLAVYSRTLTGIKEHYENSHLAVNAFASRDSTIQTIDELAANGTSGPFQLTARAVENSEKVELLVRDRNQPAIVVKSTQLIRFTDYEVVPLSGQLIFKTPIPSLDSNFNPQSIRVTYEVDTGGPAFWVAGVDAQVKLNRNVEVGALAVDDKNPLNTATLRGANATVKLDAHTFVVAEGARSDSALAGSGNAERIEVRHEDQRLQAQSYISKSDVNFVNPGSYLSQGREESALKLTYRANNRTLVHSEALVTEDVGHADKRVGAMVSVERSVDQNMRVEVGVRHGEEHGAPLNPLITGVLPNAFTSLRLKVSEQLKQFPGAGVFVEYEQDVRESARRIVAVGGTYQLPKHGRFYVRDELISSALGPYALNTTQTQNATVFGVDTDYMKDGRVFSEYRVRDAFSGADTEAAIGLRNNWKVADGLRMTTSLERVHVLNGLKTNESEALALGLDYTAPKLWKATSRLELRKATTSESLFSTLGLAAKLTPDWTILTRNSLAVTRNIGSLAGERLQDRLQAGIAYRDTATDIWNGLARIEHRHERDSTQALASVNRDVEMAALNANYQPVEPLLLSARAAAKWVTDRSAGLASYSNAQLLGGRATYDLTHRWDVGIIANVLLAAGARTRQYGMGMEIGYLVTGNLWLSAGYNVFGFRDADLAGTDYTNRGAFLRLRYKFDEDLLSGAAFRAAVTGNH